MRAFVTGGGSGIGRAIAIELGRAGFDVSIQVNNSVEAGRGVINELEAMGRKGLITVADFADKTAARKSVVTVLESWGHLDALVLNAAISSATSIFNLDDAELDAVVDTNLKAPIIVASEFMRSCRATGSGGAIVIIGSAAGQTGGALVGPHYAVSKAGTHALVKSLANAGASFGIRVNGVAPGFVDTAGLDRMKKAGNGDIDSRVPLAPISHHGN